MNITESKFDLFGLTNQLEKVLELKKYNCSRWWQSSQK